MPAPRPLETFVGIGGEDDGAAVPVSACRPMAPSAYPISPRPWSMQTHGLWQETIDESDVLALRAATAGRPPARQRQKKGSGLQNEEEPQDEDEPRSHFTLCDPTAPDLERFPLFAEAKGQEVVLGPGDGLYVPAGCWHHVRSLSRAFSVSFWF